MRCGRAGQSTIVVMVAGGLRCTLAVIVARKKEKRREARCYSWPLFASTAVVEELAVSETIV